jgi:hypothetical protein
MRDQRLLVLKNVGEEEIPAHGACEVVDAERVDSMLVYSVRRSEEDQPCTSIINFKCVIPVGKRGRPGTMDSPMRALVEEGAEAGDIVGIEKDTFILKKDLCGYIVLGDIDTEEGTATVARYDGCPNEIMVEATECLKPGEGGTAKRLKWDASANGGKGDFVDAEGETIDVCDPLCWLLAMPGDKFKVERDGCGSDSCWRPASPFGLTRRVLIEDMIDCDSKGEVKILKQDPAGTWTVAECEGVEAWNKHNRKIACDAEEEGTLHIVPGECEGWIEPRQRATRARAVLAGEMCATEASIMDIEYLDVCDWEPREEPTLAINALMQLGCSGDKVELAFNDITCGWDVISVQPTVFDENPMFDIKCDSVTCAVQKRVTVGKVAVQQCESCGEFEWKESELTGTPVDVLVTTLDCDPVNPEDPTGDPLPSRLAVSATTICAFCPTLASTKPPIPLIEVKVPTGLEVDCTGASCSAKMPTRSYWVLGCAGGVDSSGIDLSSQVNEVDVPSGGISVVEETDPYDPETVIGCNLEIATKKWCVLGCNTGDDGTPITKALEKIEPVTGVQFGPSGTYLCVTPWRTAMYVLMGCSEDEAEGASSCVPYTDECPPET